MNPYQTINMVRLLLDDSIDWFHKDIIASINEAQMRLIRQYYLTGDERSLRTLYHKNEALEDGDYITRVYPDGVVTVLMYPRALRIFNEGDNETLVATYLEPQLFYNYVQPSYILGAEFPRAAYYTIEKKDFPLSWDPPSPPVSVFGTKIRYKWQWLDSHATLWFIAEPPPFDFGDIARSLWLPEECHIEVVTLAAELLNDMDVGERERGEAVFENQRLTLQGVGNG